MSHRILVATSLIAGYLFMYVCTATAQYPVPTYDAAIDSLRKEQDEIKNDIRLIKSLLMAKTQAPNSPDTNVRDVHIALSNHPIRGREDASLVLVELSDYQCIYCSRYVRDTFPEIKKQYIDTGRIRYAVVNNPLQMHLLAPRAAEAALCANDQQKFWAMHQQLMQMQESLDDLAIAAGAAGLDIPDFDKCLSSGKHTDQVTRDISLASQMNITAVPGFILALSESNNPLMVKGLVYIRGAQPFRVFQKEIEQALSGL